MRKKEIGTVLLAIMIIALFAPTCRVHAASGFMASSEMTKPQTDDLTDEMTKPQSDNLTDEVVGPQTDDLTDEKVEPQTDDLTADITASEADVEILIEATDAVLHDHFGENYSISRKDNVITINMWTDGIANASMCAAEDDALKDDWDSLRIGVQNMSEMIYSVYKPYGLNVVVNLLNDLNKDNVLLSYMNGVLVYDSVNEVNL